MPTHVDVPPRLAQLAHALEDVRQRLRTQLDEPAPDARLPVPGDDALRHYLSLLHAAPAQIADRVNRLMPEVVANQGATERDVQRAVARFEAPVVLIADSWAELQALQAYGVVSEDFRLLAGACRHVLDEVLDWMDEVTGVVADPLAAAIARGLPTRGHVDLPLALEITTPWQLQALANRQPQAMPERRPGGLGLLGAFCLGWWLGKR